MAGISYGTKKQTDKRWAQDQLDRHSLIVGGGHLEKSEFTLPNPDGYNVIYAGTLVGRTWAEKEAGTGYGPADVANDEQIYLTTEDVNFGDGTPGSADFVSKDGHTSLYRHGSQVRETSLPNWASMNAATKAKIRELYTIVG